MDRSARAKKEQCTQTRNEKRASRQSARKSDHANADDAASGEWRAVADAGVCVSVEGNEGEREKERKRKGKYTHQKTGLSVESRDDGERRSNGEIGRERSMICCCYWREET